MTTAWLVSYRKQSSVVIGMRFGPDDARRLAEAFLIEGARRVSVELRASQADLGGEPKVATRGARADEGQRATKYRRAGQLWHARDALVRAAEYDALPALP